MQHFKSIGEFKLDLQSRNAQFGSKLVIFYSVWPWNLMEDLGKQIGHIFYTTPSFVHHFKAISEVKSELQSGNAQVGSKLVIFCPAWPWNLMDDLEKTIGHLFYTTLSFVHHFKAIGEFKLELQSGNAKFRSKSDFFLSRATLKFDGCPSKTLGHLSYASSCFVHHFVPIGEFKLESGNAQFGSKSMIFLAVWPWNLTADLEKQ